MGILAAMTLLAAMTAAEAKETATGILRAKDPGYESLRVRSTAWDEVAGAWRVEVDGEAPAPRGGGPKRVGEATLWLASPSEYVLRDQWTFDWSRSITERITNPLAPAPPSFPPEGFDPDDWGDDDDDDWGGQPLPDDPRWHRAPPVAPRQLGVPVPAAPAGARVPGALALGVAKSIAVEGGFRDVTVLTVSIAANRWQIAIAGRLKDGCGETSIAIEAMSGRLSSSGGQSSSGGGRGDCLAEYVPAANAIPRARAEALALDFARKRKIPNPVIAFTEWVHGEPGDEYAPYDAWEVSIDGTDAVLELTVRASDGTIDPGCETRIGVAPEKNAVEPSVAVRVVTQAVMKSPLPGAKVGTPRFVSVRCDGESASHWRVEVTGVGPNGTPVSDVADVDAATGRRRLELPLFRGVPIVSRTFGTRPVPSPTPDARWAALPVLAKNTGDEGVGDAKAIETALSIARKLPMREMRIGAAKEFRTPFTAWRIEVRGRTEQGCGSLRVGLTAETHKPFELSLAHLRAGEWIERCEVWVPSTSDAPDGLEGWGWIDAIGSGEDSLARELGVRLERPAAMTVPRVRAESAAVAVALKKGLKDAKPVGVRWRALPAPEWRISVLGLGPGGCSLVTSRISGTTGEPVATFHSEPGPRSGCAAWFEDGDFEDGDPEWEQDPPPWP